MMNAADIKIRESAENRIGVWDFFRENPCHSKQECAAALGITTKTVAKHCRAIREGWRPDVNAVDAIFFAKYCTIVDGVPRLQIGGRRFAFKAPWDGWSNNPSAALDLHTNLSNALANLVAIDRSRPHGK